MSQDAHSGPLRRAGRHFWSGDQRVQTVQVRQGTRSAEASGQQICGERAQRFLPGRASHQKQGPTVVHVALQRQEYQTVRTAPFATVQLSLSTPPAKPKAHHHHYLRDALPWLGGAAAALLLLLVLRVVMRLREARLLSRS